MDKKKSYAIIGASSKISQELTHILDKKNLNYTLFGRDRCKNSIDAINFSDNDFEKILNCDASHYLFNMGVLHNNRLVNQTKSEIVDSLLVNLIFPIACIDRLLSKKPELKVVILGSESGIKGSFDTTYFLAKAALRAYVRERSISYPNQSILLLSPSTIEDASMTTSRKDQDRLAEYKSMHPKKRFLTSYEVANAIFDLFAMSDYFTNTELELTGGKLARMKY